MCHHQLSTHTLKQKENEHTKNIKQLKLNRSNKLVAFLSGKLYFILQVCDCH